MDASALESPLLDSGVPAVNFFNGRLLTASDLRREQDSRRTHDRWLGKAIGAGVAFGLDVKRHADSTVQAPLVTIEAGLAVNRDGQALHLKSQARIALVRKAAASVGSTATFGECGALTGGAYVAGPGVYLLTLAPASAPQGKALTSGFDQYGGKCNTDVLLETVQFRLIALDLMTLALSAPPEDLAQESRFRNALAHRLLGEPSPAFDPAAEDPVATIAGAPFTDCDVPLAIVYWTIGGGLRFIDQWSVRRRLRPPLPEALGAAWLRPGSTAVGEARLLQFAAHVRDILPFETNPATRRIEECFRHVPAAAWVPVTGAGSIGGYGPARWLSSYARGAPDHLSAALAAGVLDRSFVSRSVDLDAAASFQLYEIDENVSDLAAGATNQRQLLFVHRELHGPASRDLVTSAFEDAWTVHRGLIRRRVFVPVGGTAEETAARIGIVGAIRDVMDTATLQAAKAWAWSLATRDALGAFEALYDVQHDLNALLASNIPGVSGAQERQAFAATIAQLLDGDLPGPKPGLKKSLANASLSQAVEAQEAINHFVGTWTGEGVAVGPFGFGFDRSDNTKLVPGEAASAQFFTLSNGTDKTVTLLLTGAATAANGNWAASVRILGSVGGAELDRVTLASGASRPLVVMVAAPSGAIVGDAITLTLTAEVGPPTNRTSTYENSALLQVASAGGGPVAGVVDIFQTRLLPAGTNPADIPPNTPFRLMASVNYAAGDGIARDFDLDLMVTAGDASVWTFRNDDTGATLPSSPTGTGFTLRMNGVPADQSPALGRIRVQSPARSPTVDRSVTLALSIRSVDLTPAITDPSPPAPITLVVKLGS